MNNFNQKHLTLNEVINSITHGIGALASIFGLIYLVIMAGIYGTTWHVVSFSIFGSSMILLYTCSMLYHSFTKPNIKAILQKLDHSAIYILIAGTYTPFALVTLRGPWGWSIFGIIWGLAIAGIIFQLLFYKEKLRFVSSIIYLAMGWIVIIAIKPLLNSLPTGGLLWLLGGGLFYSVGVVFYLWRKLPFNHGIWHLFVLGGTVCHFFSIYQYVLLK
jgi:hemolysin III